MVGITRSKVFLFLKLDQQNRSVTPHNQWVHPPPQKKKWIGKKKTSPPKKMEWPVPSSQTDRGRYLNPPQKKVIQPAHVFFRLKVSPLQSWLQLSLLSVFWSPFRRFRVGMADGIPTGLLCNVHDIRVHDRLFSSGKLQKFLNFWMSKKICFPLRIDHWFIYYSDGQGLLHPTGLSLSCNSQVDDTVEWFRNPAITSWGW